jgi:hypothetical protein
VPVQQSSLSAADILDPIVWESTYKVIERNWDSIWVRLNRQVRHIEPTLVGVTVPATCYSVSQTKCNVDNTAEFI